jgi:hypothetical protein
MSGVGASKTERIKVQIHRYYIITYNQFLHNLLVYISVTLYSGFRLYINCIKCLYKMNPSKS